MFNPVGVWASPVGQSQTDPHFLIGIVFGGDYVSGSCTNQDFNWKQLETRGDPLPPLVIPTYPDVSPLFLVASFHR
jgi:hypothetical protein